MPKISIRLVVIFLPLLVALILFVWFEIRQGTTRESVTQFERERSQHGFTHIDNIENLVGIKKTRRVLREVASRDAMVTFDGDSRCVQIIEIDFDSKDAVGDGIAMYTLGPYRMTKSLCGPFGTKIKKAEFKGDYLVIHVHGTLELSDRHITIPQNKPDEYSIHWPKNTPPPADFDLWELILARHPDIKKSNKANR